MIVLSAEQKKMVKDILRTHVPHARVLVFGSRARGDVKPYSDLDLSVMGENPMTLAEIGSLREAFSASNLPFRVDIVDWMTTDPAFRTVIERDGEEI